jgi:hypothetical protein
MVERNMCNAVMRGIVVANPLFCHSRRVTILARKEETSGVNAVWNFLRSRRVRVWSRLTWSPRFLCGGPPP